jgi:hypothetical protein
LSNSVLKLEQKTCNGETRIFFTLELYLIFAALLWEKEYKRQVHKKTAKNKEKRNKCVHKQEHH